MYPSFVYQMVKPVLSRSSAVLFGAGSHPAREPEVILAGKFSSGSLAGDVSSKPVPKSTAGLSSMNQAAN